VTPDFYAVLGVASDANQELIRAAYLVLAKRYHPDSATAASPKNDEKFRSVTEAYEKLRDPNRRRQYDMQQARQKQSGPELEQSEHSRREAREKTRRRDQHSRQEQERKEARARAGYTQPYKRSASAGRSSQTKGQTEKNSAAEGNAARPQTRSRNSLVFSGGAFALAALVLGLIALASKSPANIERRTDAAEEQDSTTTAPVDRSGAIASIAPEAVARKADCTAADGTKFAITNQGGVVNVAFNGAAPKRARVDAKGPNIVLLSKFEPFDRIAIAVVKGDRDGTEIIVSDSAGNPIQTIKAKCSDAAFR
jgi:curved DNA-binding protein CbpA